MGLSLVEYSKSLPLSGDEEAKLGYNLLALARDLLAHLRANFTSNGVVVPVLQTFNVLLEADALRRLPEDPRGEIRSVASKSILIRLASSFLQSAGSSVHRDQECRTAQEHPAGSRVHEDVRFHFVSE